MSCAVLEKVCQKVITEKFAYWAQDAAQKQFHGFRQTFAKKLLVLTINTQFYFKMMHVKILLHVKNVGNRDVGTRKGWKNNCLSL